MAFTPIVKGEYDWHEKINANFEELSKSAGFNENVLNNGTDYDAVVDNGTYLCDTTTGANGSNVPVKNDKGLLLVRNNGADFVMQEYRSFAGHIMQRTATIESLLYTWGEWEWVNPPMIHGVEYRLTERWHDKPVYVVTIHAASLPNDTLLMIDTGVTMGEVVSISGYATKSDGEFFPFPVIPGTGATPVAGISNVVASEGFFIVYTSRDLTTYQAYFTIKYTKPSEEAAV